MGMQGENPNCHQCRFFKVTWDKRFPYGCERFGIRCKQIPSVEVVLTTGEKCIFFQPKPGAEAEEQGQALRDYSTFTISG